MPTPSTQPPTVPVVEPTDGQRASASVDPHLFAAALERCIPFTGGPLESRDVLRCVYLHVGSDGLAFAAADGNTLIETRMRAAGGDASGSAGVLLHATTAKEWAKAAKGTPGLPVALDIAGRKITLTLPGAALSATSTPGHFPQWSQLIPQADGPDGTAWAVNPDYLLRASRAFTVKAAPLDGALRVISTGPQNPVKFVGFDEARNRTVVVVMPMFVSWPGDRDKPRAVSPKRAAAEPAPDAPDPDATAHKAPHDSRADTTCGSYGDDLCDCPCDNPACEACAIERAEDAEADAMAEHGGADADPDTLADAATSAAEQASWRRAAAERDARRETESEHASAANVAATYAELGIANGNGDAPAPPPQPAPQPATAPDATPDGRCRRGSRRPGTHARRVEAPAVDQARPGPRVPQRLDPRVRRRAPQARVRQARDPRVRRRQHPRGARHALQQRPGRGPGGDAPGRVRGPARGGPAHRHGGLVGWGGPHGPPHPPPHPHPKGSPLPDTTSPANTPAMRSLRSAMFALDTAERYATATYVKIESDAERQYQVHLHERASQDLVRAGELITAAANTGADEDAHASDAERAVVILAARIAARYASDLVLSHHVGERERTS